MKNVRACKGNSAVQVVAFVIEFSEELNIETLNLLNNIYNQNEILNEKNFKKHNQSGVTIQIDEIGQQVTTHALIGIIFDSIDNNWSLQVRKEAIIVTCKNYTKWFKIWDKVQALFSLCIPYISVRSNKMTLEYVNEFFITNSASNWHSELLNLETKYLTKNMFEMQENNSWHIHQGFFSKVCDDVETLSNLNIDYRITESNESSLIVRTQYRNILSKNMFLSEIDTVFYNTFNNVNMLNKSILNDLLSDNIKIEINLKGD